MNDKVPGNPGSQRFREVSDPGIQGKQGLGDPGSRDMGKERNVEVTLMHGHAPEPGTRDQATLRSESGLEGFTMCGNQPDESHYGGSANTSGPLSMCPFC